MRSDIYQTFLEGHISTEGTVIVRIRERPSGLGDLGAKRYYILIHFTTNSGPVTLNAEVNKRFFDQAIPEASIGIRYAEADPRIAQVEGEY